MTDERDTTTETLAEGDVGVQDVADRSLVDEHVAELLEHTIDVPVLASAVARQEAADAADTLEDLAATDAAEVLGQMEDLSAASALAEMQPPLALGIVEDIAEEDPGYAGRLLGLMAPDDAADLLQALDDDRRHDLIASMEPEQARIVARLMHYDEESAGGMMTTDFLALREGMSIGQATDYIRASAVPPHAHHALVTDDAGRLVGVISLRRLLLAQPRERIGDLMDRSVQAVHPDVDREEVAKTFDRYDFSTLAVVDDDDRLLGLVTVDDVIDIIRAEQTEDVQKTVGAGAGEAVYSSLREKFRGRFPWLVASLVMTCCAAIVVLVFDELIRAQPILAFLLPVIAALVGNAGHQALAVTLRGLVLDEVRPDRVMPLVLREGMLGLLNGVMLGALMMLGIGLLTTLRGEPNWMLAGIVASSMLVAMGVGTLAGSGIPLIMRRLGADPAAASAIVLIMITDAVSFSTLLVITSALIGAA